MTLVRITIPTLALLIVAGLALSPAVAEDDTPASQVDQLAKVVAKANVSLAAATVTALKHEKVKTGTAVAAKIELEDGKPVWEIYILVPGTPARLAEVEVDGATGKIIEVEFEDEEDEGDDEEDEDDDADDDAK